ncbi:MAG: helix-turn-helix domain-containing protein [Phenylobacterium sp.]
MTQADSLLRGLEEALAFRHGETTNAAVRQVEIPAEVDVAAIRARTGLSQGAFARSIGVPRATLLNWEHGRRRPTGPARVLLALIDRRPALVTQMLG